MSTRPDDPYRAFPPEEGSDEAENLRTVNTRLRDKQERLEREARREAWEKFRQSTAFVGMIALVVIALSPILVGVVALWVREFLYIAGT